MFLTGNYSGTNATKQVWPITPSISLAPIVGTKYYKFHEVVAVSRGPKGLLVQPEDFIFDVWVAYQAGTTIEVQRFNGVAWVDTTVIASDLVGTVKHISLTFDQIGNPVCAFQIENTIYLRWYDPVLASNTVTVIGEGKSPFICMEFFNSYLGARQIHLIYAKPRPKEHTFDIVCRLQDERYTEEHVVFPTTRDVLGLGIDDILSFGVTAFNNLKIVYTAKNFLSQGIYNIATPRKGLWQGDSTPQTVTPEVQRLEIVDASKIINDVVEPGLPDKATVDSSGTVVSIGLVLAIIIIDNTSQPDLATVDSSGTVTFIELKNVTINNSQEEPIPAALSSTTSDFIVGVEEAAIQTSQEEPIPAALSSSISNFSLTVV